MVLSAEVANEAYTLQTRRDMVATGMNTLRRIDGLLGDAVTGRCQFSRGLAGRARTMKFC